MVLSAATSFRLRCGSECESGRRHAPNKELRGANVWGNLSPAPAYQGYLAQRSGHTQAIRYRYALGGACSPLHAWFSCVWETGCNVAQRARDCAFHLGLEFSSSAAQPTGLRLISRSLLSTVSPRATWS